MRNATSVLSVLEEELRPGNAQGTIALERYISRIKWSSREFG